MADKNTMKVIAGACDEAIFCNKGQVATLTLAMTTKLQNSLQINKYFFYL
ncbi:MAG: hypothetical protein ACK5MG_00895 [Bacteroidales bacterium]